MSNQSNNSGEHPADAHGPFGPYRMPQSRDFSAEQRRELDDVFFESNPAGYWRARIDSLLRDPVPIDYTTIGGVAPKDLGIDPQLLTDTQPTAEERAQQIALDAFALRHHLAESLARLVHAVLSQYQEPERSVWELMADSPRQSHKVVEGVLALVQEELPAGLFFLTPDHIRSFEHQPPDERLDAAMRMHWSWVLRAFDLITGDGLDANVAHNKFKHGFALHQRNNLLVSFMRTGPDANGNVSKAALETESINIIDSTAVEFLSKVPNRERAAGSWEVTLLNLRTPKLLAESITLSTVWTGVFASAAARHFDGRDQVPPPHPGFILGPPPERFLTEPTGMRQSLTLPDNDSPARGIVVGLPPYLIRLNWDGNVMRGRVVD